MIVVAATDNVVATGIVFVETGAVVLANDIVIVTSGFGDWSFSFGLILSL